MPAIIQLYAQCRPACIAVCRPPCYDPCNPTSISTGPITFFFDFLSADWASADFNAG